MNHPYLTDPRHASAYQTLCNNPRGSTRAWADKAGWTYAEMRTFLGNLQKFGLAKVVRVGNMRVFEVCEGVREYAKVCEGMRGCAPPYLKAGKKPDKVSRYGEQKSKTIRALAPDREPTSDEAKLIEALNEGLRDAGFGGVEPHKWSLAAAEKILAKIPIERAAQLLTEAGRQFNPSQTGGEEPFSLGHPFFVRYVLNESKRLDREDAKEQLPLPIMQLQRSTKNGLHKPKVESRSRVEPTPQLSDVANELVAELTAEAQA